MTDANGPLDPALAELARNRMLVGDVAYRAISEAIQSGQVAPGQKLLQEELARQLNVSQATIRQALSRLVADGLVVQEPYRGFRVTIIPPEEHAEILKLRGLLESWAFEEAAPRLSDKELARMRELLPLSVPDDTPESYPRSREANREFHWTAIRASRRPHLIQLLERLWERVLPYQKLPTGTAEEQRRANETDIREHTAILEALEARDAKRAARAVARTYLHSGWPGGVAIPDD